MKIMHCPLNGPRNISEFISGGEVTDMPEPAETDDDTWADYVWMRNNIAGVVTEWWCHVPTSYWFLAERDTVTDQIICTYPANERYKERINFKSDTEENP
ncbi:MAG: sarcosine oxidase subunit delta [Gammaproteobacteria bacterium]